MCGNRTCTFTASVFSYPHIVHFFWKVHFWTAPVETKIRFLLQVYFGSTCFPKVKRTLNCFKIVRVSTGFGEFKAKVPCKHFGEESICSIMFFFPIRVHLFLSAPSSYAVQPCAHRSLRLGSCSARSSARSSALQRVRWKRIRTCRFEPEDITQHVTRCIYLFTYFSDVEMEFLVCTCHVRLICLFIYVYPKFFCWSFSPPTWPKRHDISSILSGISQYQKHTISLSQGNLKKKIRFLNQTWHGTPHLQWDNLLIDKL